MKCPKFRTAEDYRDHLPCNKCEPVKKHGWYGTDLDGTLAYHGPGDSVSKVGKPIPAMLNRVKNWLAEGYEVKIVTARVSPEWDDRDEQIKMIQDWCLEHIGQILEVRCHKDGGMVELWDDRAVGVVRNTGQRIGGTYSDD